MDKEQILALAEKCGIFPRLTPDGTDEVWSTKRDVESFFDAAIESYKAELLKEVGEPIYQVCKSDSISLSSAWIDVTEQTYNDAGLYPEYGRRILYTSDQVAAAILKATGPLEKEIERLKTVPMKYRRMAFNAQLQDENNELRTQLAAAQEEYGRLNALMLERNQEYFQQLAKAEQLWQVAQGRWDGLEEKLAKAEQRVAEACALQVATETKFHWLDAARVAKEIRSGEWRKFLKEA